MKPRLLRWRRSGPVFLQVAPAMGKEFLRHRAPPFRLGPLTSGRGDLSHGAPLLEDHAARLSGFPRPLEGEPTVEPPVKFRSRPGRDALHLFASSFRVRVFASPGVSPTQWMTVNGGVNGRR